MTLMSESVNRESRGRPTSWPDGWPHRAWKLWFVRAAAMAVLLTSAFLLGGWIMGGGREAAARAPTDDAGSRHDILYWTCSMHPQIKLPGKGQCPICFMDLIPVQSDDGGEGRPHLTLSDRARILARVATTPVTRRELTHELTMTGKVVPDETRISYVSSYFPGRIDRLFVNYTGIFVRKGDHLAEVYSPELLVAQHEYLLAREEVGRARQSSDEAERRRAEAALQAARRKLELWAVPADEIERLSREQKATDHIRLDAPHSGWVLERQAFQGMYVDMGTRLFTLADLRSVWVLLDAYELDLPFLCYGQRVEFETEAYPGRRFEGRISYLDPRLTEVTRTVKVRVNVANEAMQLRPGMFLRATVRIQLGEDGRVIEPSLNGKWLCPMHPEIVKDESGTCDDCGMDLVTAESLGFARPHAPAARVLAVPQSAVLLTGRRAVVYVEKQDPSDGVSYEGRVVELGPRAGEWYVVLSGLTEGERVVTRGAFQIDSALQIQARPSMMQPTDEPDGSPPATHTPSSHDTSTVEAVASRAVAHAAYHRHMRPALEAMIAFTEALAADDVEAARTAAQKTREALGQAAPHGLEPEAVALFTRQTDALRNALPAPDEKDIEALRDKLAPLNRAMETYLRTFGHDRDQPYIRMFCPMAFDNRGAIWFQFDDQVRNPYFGRRMYRCGEAIGRLAADGREVRP